MTANRLSVYGGSAEGWEPRHISLAECLGLTTDALFSLALVDDQPPLPASLFNALGLSSCDARLFSIIDSETAYSLFTTNPFPFDGVFLDWRLDDWPPFSLEQCARTGLPDTLARGGAFPRLLLGDDKERALGARRGGHAELLISLAASRGVLTVALSEYIAAVELPGIALRARGAHCFLPKRDLRNPDQSRVLPELRELLFALAGWSRDLRLWRSLTPEQSASVSKRLRELSSSEIAERMAEFEQSNSKDRHNWITSGYKGVEDYLIGSLTWLGQPRLCCSVSLLDEAIKILPAGDPLLSEICDKVKVLLPSFGSPKGGGQQLKDELRSIFLRVTAAHDLHALNEGEDHFHIMVGPRAERIDYFASKQMSSSLDSLAFEYLGTSFSPRLAATIDENGVWPASKLSKLRHLLRARRDRRIFHEHGATVRCAEGVFGPTIDSLLLGGLLITLLSYPHSPLAHIKRVVEVGTGTGYLLCLAAVTLGNQLDLLAGSDISDLAVECSSRNLRIAWPTGVQNGKAHIVLSSDVLSLVPAGTIDLIISNPPYLPAKPIDLASSRPGENSAIAGERVLRDILLGSGPTALRMEGVILFVTSTLSLQILEDLVEEARLAGVMWFSKSLLEIPWVPLDLPEVQEDPEWVQALLATRSAHVLVDITSGQHSMRHGIVVAAFSRTESIISRIEECLRRPSEGRAGS